MPIIPLDNNLSTPLVEQIVNGLQQRIEQRSLRSGTRLPSIRDFAREHGVSRFTVVTAYDRLVASAYLQSRPGSGFYVAPRPEPAVSNHTLLKLDAAEDMLWLLHNALSHPGNERIPGAGWLPADWQDEKGIQRSLRHLSRHSGSFLTHYGSPGGYQPLREWLARRLLHMGVEARSEQILLTRGATHGLDLITRYLVRPGDTVLIDDPGYFVLTGMLKSLGARVIGVPWNPDGPDVAVMAQLVERHQPKLFITNTILHNPTGATISQAVAFRLLQLAEQYQLTIIEDDIYGDFHPGAATRLASLDQLKRVIYVSSYSKTISASIRVGYVACSMDLVQRLSDLKLLTGMTSPELNERLIYQMLTAGSYRKHMEKIRARLRQGLEQTMSALEILGLPLYTEPQGGMFIWVKMPEHVNVVSLATAAARQGLTLAPGNLFRPHQEPGPWLRFNVASSDQPELYTFLQKQIQDEQQQIDQQ